MKTEVIKVKDKSDPGVEKAAELLKKGEVVAIPTETVYGLAANAFDETSPPLVRLGIRLLFLRMIVKGPGQNAFASASAFSGIPSTSGAHCESSLI